MAKPLRKTLDALDARERSLKEKIAERRDALDGAASPPDPAGDVADKAAPVVDKAQDSAGEAWDKSKDTAGDAVDKTKDTVSELTDRGGDAASDAKSDAPGSGPSAA